MCIYVYTNTFTHLPLALGWPHPGYDCQLVYEPVNGKSAFLSSSLPIFMSAFQTDTYILKNIDQIFLFSPFFGLPWLLYLCSLVFFWNSCLYIFCVPSNYGFIPLVPLEIVIYTHALLQPTNE